MMVVVVIYVPKAMYIKMSLSSRLTRSDFEYMNAAFLE